MCQVCFENFMPADYTENYGTTKANYYKPFSD